MEKPEEHRLYPAILKMVLWDEPQERITTRLEANEISDEVAKALLTATRKERLKTIRKDYIQKMALSFLVFIFGCLFFLLAQRYVVSVLQERIALFITVLLVGGSLLGLLNGVIAYCMASKKRGSVADF